MRMGIAAAALLMGACSAKAPPGPVNLTQLSNSELCIMVVEQPELAARAEREMMNREAACFWGEVRKTLENRQRASISGDPMLIAYYKVQRQQFPMTSALLRLHGARGPGCSTLYSRNGAESSCIDPPSEVEAKIKSL